ncbi:MAG: FAD-dependent oxidoreductase [Chloroflexota bacterium]
MSEITLKIDGVGVKAKDGATVLQATQAAGIYIPALCSHPDLKPMGQCRLCVVEIEGASEPMLACQTQVASGMAVVTDSEVVKKRRQENLRDILLTHPHACLDCWRRERCKPYDICLRNVAVTERCVTCEKNGHCELQKVADFIGVLPDIPYTPKKEPVRVESPFFVRDYNLCILCGRCVRVCQDVRGVGVYTFDNEEKPTRVLTVKGDSVIESGCRSCMACVEVCPTGALIDRRKEKLWVDRQAFIVPCKHACPAHINIPRYVTLCGAGKYAEALAVIREKVPFPGSLGRVCIHPCEEACRRGELNSPISIKELKRAAADRGGDAWKAKSKKLAPTGKKVAVVGAGPAGLTAAYYLAKCGHSVTVFEALPEAGGMMRVGIPEYRLPRNILADEVKVITDAGVELKTNTRVESVDDLMSKGFESVLLAVGAHRGTKMRVPGEELPGVMDGATFLREVNLGRKVNVGNKVAVVGGGNSAIDSARVALRAGAKEVVMVYRRTRAEMPAAPEEIEDALQEGIKIEFLAAPSKIVQKDGRLSLECIRMRLGRPDASGRRSPEPIPGSEYSVGYDTIIASIGQAPDVPQGFNVKTGRGNTVAANEKTLETSRKGVFAAGDAVTGPASVIEAIAAGRQAAISIDKFLGGKGMIEESLALVEPVSKWLGKDDGFSEKKREEGVLLAPAARIGSFVECKAALTDDESKREGNRCLRCDLRLTIYPAPVPPVRKESPILV